jgi:hypothetical protein
MMEQLKKLFKTNPTDANKAEKYQRVFSGLEGQEVLEDLLKFCKVNQPTYTPGDSLTTSYNEGLRRVGLRLLALTQSEKQTKR